MLTFKMILRKDSEIGNIDASTLTPIIVINPIMSVIIRPESKGGIPQISSGTRLQDISGPQNPLIALAKSPAKYLRAMDI